MKKLFAIVSTIVAISGSANAAITGLKGLLCHAYNVGGIATLTLTEEGKIEALTNGFWKTIYEPLSLGTKQTTIGSQTTEYSFLLLEDKSDSQTAIYFTHALVEGKQTLAGQLANIAKKVAPADGSEPKVSPLDYVPLANLTCEIEMVGM